MRGQTIRHHRVLLQLIRRGCERHHTLLLAATFFACAHTRQVIVKHCSTVPPEHTTTPSTIVPLPIRAVPIGNAHTVVELPNTRATLVLLCFSTLVRFNVRLKLPQTALIIEAGQLVRACRVPLVQVLQIRHCLGRVRPHQMPRVPLLRRLHWAQRRVSELIQLLLRHCASNLAVRTMRVPFAHIKLTKLRPTALKLAVAVVPQQSLTQRVINRLWLVRPRVCWVAHRTSQSRAFATRRATLRLWILTRTLIFGRSIEPADARSSRRRGLCTFLTSSIDTTLLA